MSGEPSAKKAKTDLEVFDDIFTVLVDDLTKHGLKDDEISGAMKWFKKVLEYNVPYGKKNRGLTVVQSYRFIMKEKAQEEDLKLARILGWCIELLQAFFLVADDIMDHSHTRRGRPCWFRNKDVGLEAINDSFYLESAIYVLLKKYFKSKAYYVNLLELFHETTIQTVTGQCLDMLTAEDGKADYTKFTVENHKAIVKWKTAFYSFYMPVACALFMTNIEEEEAHNNAKTILLKMGEYFQIQDDYLDCYGDPAVIGKIGTDIQDSKCSWLIVQALLKATEQQKQELLNNYGIDDPEKIQRVKDIYKELNLSKVYTDYEEQSYTDITKLIEKLSGDLPTEMFTAFANKIYKRQK